MSSPPAPVRKRLPNPDDELLNSSSSSSSDDEHLNPNNYASSSRWRHQESSSFRKEAAREADRRDRSQQRGTSSNAVARDPEVRGGRVNDLADFLNSSRISDAEIEQEHKRQGGSAPNTPKFKPVIAASADIQKAAEGGSERPETALAQGPSSDGKEVVCGPLLNYRRMEGNRWFGSVLVVVKGGGKTQPYQPTLVLRPAGGGDEGAPNGAVTDFGASQGGRDGVEVEGTCLYSDPRNTFWRFDLAVEVRDVESRWEYTLPDLRFKSNTKPQRNVFNVPAKTEAFRIMFHSCNGFSVGTDEEAWSGPALWNDVLRCHAKAPFHVMIGGGDQIYNDSIRVSGPLREWTSISNPKKRREYPFPEKLRQECDDFYLQNYLKWYSTGAFATANGQIPQLNIWDDHDIIDGFGSYVNDFMMCDVFRGIGGTAHKYYMLFQHHLPPPQSTYTSDLVAAKHKEKGQGIDPNQMAEAYIHPAMTESNYIVGAKPGPYVAEHSHNMFAKLGARIAFLGIDARTERTRHQVNYPETYNQIFDRLRQELSSEAEAGTPYKHLILLLGIPIAYPRLTWLENIFASPFIGPIKFMNRRFGLGGGVFNAFDGSVDLLDDLDDHYTARTHKKERNAFVERLQSICAEFSIRITILGGDVHLAALGRFYSNPHLNIPAENDHRYMVNVVSSAITNKPPPQAIANLLARRNKIHHLNHETDETLLKLFNKDPGDKPKTANHNKVTMPSRNFAVITENSPNNAPASLTLPRTADANTLQVPPSRGGAPPSRNGASVPPSRDGNASISNGGDRSHSAATSIRTGKSSSSSRFPGKDGHYPIHAGEAGCGTKHKAASPTDHGRGNDGSLDVQIRVEIDQHDREGRTEPYGLTIPALDYRSPAPASVTSQAPVHTAA
ncbi:hypothetical protein GE09DRAFT_1174310 [Coniochaeta sp. 2T2.1]|nr:hypothetical protein GE09DRAFT_1174310 [Coniochaeta sp. 2T2.1]